MLHPAAIFDAEQARAADKAAIQGGIPGEALMENAGHAAVDYIVRQIPLCPVLIVCGTGNNGGDGFVVARLLKEKDWPVTAAVIGNGAGIRGDAALARDKWLESGGAIESFAPALLADKQLLVDALFGTGLDRPIEGKTKEAIDSINGSKIPVVALDIASGIDSSTGAVLGAAVHATHTVAFARAKLGHVLLPGKAHTYRLHVADIGISGDGINPRYFLNVPPLWLGAFPHPPMDTHKYARGHALVIGGEAHSTGAARLAATAALRVGAGAVSVACSPESLPVYATALVSVMTKPVANPSQLEELLEDKRTSAALIGPGCGVSEQTRERVLQILSHKTPCVLDADALSAFKPNPKTLFSAIAGPVILTPHEGEFARLFAHSGSKVERAQAAAKQSGAVVVLKGSDTVIAAPDGRVAVNANALVWLATAGSGDVLAGLISGLLAQGMPAWEAACAGTWIHGETGSILGPGLIAEDLPAAIPPILKKLYER